MKKKIIFVIPHLTIGGVQKSLISALKVIDYDKFDVTVYLRKNRTDLLQLIDKRAAVIINDDKAHYYRKPYAVFLQLLCFAFKLIGKGEKADKINIKLTDFIVKDSMEYEHKQFFENQKYDIAIAYVQGYVAQFVAEYVSAEKKFVFYHTSTDELHEVHEKIIEEFDKVVAIHAEQKELIKKWYPTISDRISVVENYCDKALIEEQSKAFAVDKPKNKAVLCSCGRFSKVKGFDLAVEAAGILKERGVSFFWYFVGDGPERESLEKLIEKYNLQEEICITGMQKNPYPYMNVCDIYVQASYEEAMPLTLIEAKRLGKPMITTETVGGRKLVQCGIDGLVCLVSSEGIASAVEKLITDKELFDKICNILSQADYSNEFNNYKAQWQNLLEE